MPLPSEVGKAVKIDGESGGDGARVSAIRRHAASTGLPARPPSQVDVGRPLGTRLMLLVVLCSGQCLVVIDFAGVAIALPSIQNELNLSTASVQWVLTLFAVAFGGMLLFGGRLADVYGRDRVLRTGLVVFAVGSLMAGLALTPATLLVARVVQGVGAALLVPAALSLITTTFHGDDDRRWALGIYGAIFSVGFVAGSVLGGILVEVATWRSVFLANVPLGLSSAVLVAALAPRHEAGPYLRLDLAGAVTITIALALLVYALAQWSAAGPASGSAITAGFMAMALGVTFTFIEYRSETPLVPRVMLRSPALGLVVLAAILMMGSVDGAIFVMTFHMQSLARFSAGQAGLGLAALGVGAIVAGGLASRLTARVRTRPALALGLALQTAGILLLLQVSLPRDLVLMGSALGLLGFGNVIAIVMLTAIAAAHAAHRDHGVLGGILNTAQQVGAGVGVAIVAGFASNRGRGSGADQIAEAPALHGVQRGLALAALLSGLALVLVAAMRRPRGASLSPRPGHEVAESVPDNA
jgi:MFS family permease